MLEDTDEFPIGDREEYNKDFKEVNDNEERYERRRGIDLFFGEVIFKEDIIGTLVREEPIIANKDNDESDDPRI